MVFDTTEAVVTYDDGEKNGRKEEESVCLTCFVLSCHEQGRVGQRHSVASQGGQSFKQFQTASARCVCECVRANMCVRVGQGRVGWRDVVKGRGKEYTDILLIQYE